MFGLKRYRPTPKVIREENGKVFVKVGLRRYEADPNAIAYSLGKYNRLAQPYYNIYHIRHYRLDRGFRFVAIQPEWEEYIAELNECKHRYPRPILW